MKYKIFKGSNVQEGVDKCLNAGFFPATLKQVYDWKMKNKRPMWFDTGTVYFEGDIRKVKLSELKDLKAFYDKGGRLLVLGFDYFGGGLSGGGLYNDARFLGVKE